MASAKNREVTGAHERLLQSARRLEATGRRLLSAIDRSLRDSERCLQRCGPQSMSLRHSIEGRLRSSPFLPLRHITCEEQDGRVILRGRVPTQYLQALAGSVAKSFDGVREIKNNIEVVPLGRAYAPISLLEARPPARPASMP